MMKKNSKEKKMKVNFADSDNDKCDAHPKIDKLDSNSHSTVIKNRNVPEELLTKILCYTDYKTLLTCQLVCKHWHHLIQNYVWHKKAEIFLNQTLPFDKKIPWKVYYFICDGKPFYKNLVKNHSGEHGIFKDWVVTENGGKGWAIESYPKGVKALPNDPVFEDKSYCFSTSFSRCWKEQVINLIDEGFSERLLDYFQPTIKISEWFCCRPDIPAVYECTIKLLRDQKSDRTFIETLNYRKVIEGEQMNEWFQFTHEFKNYGKGLRKIKFGHGGQDRSYVSGSCGSKMAGACVMLEIKT